VKIRECFESLRKLFKEANEYLQMATSISENEIEASRIQNQCAILAECLYDAKMNSHMQNKFSKDEMKQSLISAVITIYYKSARNSSNEASSNEDTSLSPVEQLSPKNFKTRQTNAILAHHFLKDKTQKLKELSPFRKKE
jgi:hypothetical protein